MATSTRVPIAASLSAVAESQHGCFTRAQAVREGVSDMVLQRAVKSGVIERLDHGVYRIVGAGDDPHRPLRVAWLRLTPELSARERTLRPHLWVSHRSAAALFDLGVSIADTPEFISDRRLQTRAKVRIHLRSEGLKREDWMVHDGFAVTTPARTIADLATDHMDGGHLGRIAADALARGMVTETEMERALDGRADLAAILELAMGKVR